jgi:hypothetical protein
MVKFALATLCTFLVSAGPICGGKAARAPRPPASEEDFYIAAQFAVNSSLLSREDFGVGWYLERSDDSVSPPEEEATFYSALSPECAEDVDYQDDAKTFPAAVFENESESFSFDVKESEEVSSVAAAYHSEAASALEFDAIVLVVDRCGTEIAEGLRRVLTSDPEFPGAEAEVSIQRLEDPPRAERAARYVLSIKLVVGDFMADYDSALVYVQSGRMLGFVGWTDWGDFEADFGEELVSTVAERLERADKALPVLATNP